MDLEMSHMVKLRQCGTQKGGRQCETVRCHPGLAYFPKCFRLPSSLRETQLPGLSISPTWFPTFS